MPQYPQPGGDQRSQQKFLVFDRWKKMNTQAARTGLPDDQLAWAENLQPIAENKWQVVPSAASTALITFGGSMVLAFYATINGNDYVIFFSATGGGWAFNLTTNILQQFAADGTFSTAPDCTTYLGQRILINDSKAGYCTWDGTMFVQQGSVSPNIVITNTGANYGAPPTVTITDTTGHGTGATGVATILNGEVVGVQLTAPGAAYDTTSTPTISFSGGTGSGASFSPNMSTMSVASVFSTNAGGFASPGLTIGASVPLTITGGGGSGAAANAITAFLSTVGFYIGSITFVSGGSGYTSPPTVVWPSGLHPITSGTGPSFGVSMGPRSVSSVSLGAGGSGYPVSTSIPLVFSGGGGSPQASGSATTNSSGVVTGGSVSFGGSYPYPNAPSVDVAAGAGAAATAIIWPFVPKGTTLAVFQGRVWLGGGALLQWTGTGANRNPGITYDDFDPQNASGSLQITDADLVHQISALRSLNNYLWIVGDQSVKQIGNLSISGTSPPVTLFTILTLSSDQGTIWPKSCISFNRIFMFANPNGIYGVFGSTVQKISDDLDGIFQAASFAQQPQGAVVDLNSKHNAVFLLRYVDPIAGTRSLLLMFDGQKWWLANQGTGIVTITTYPQLASDLNTLIGSLTGQDLTQLFFDPTTAVPFKLQTALSHGQNPVQGKRVVRGGFTADAAGAGSINANIDFDLGSDANVFGVGATTLLVGGANDANNSPVAGAGIYLGATVTGTMKTLVMQNVILEYQETSLWKGA